jgi:HSP20 family molecular chaperone IbpA
LSTLIKNIIKYITKEVSRTVAEQIIDSGNAYSPDVDIFINNDMIVFIAELPGVSKGDTSIEITENDTLVIKAKNSHKEPENMVIRQYGIGNYYRAFQISDEFDKEQVSAKLENGMLEIRIPKREEAKPRKIAINA